MSGVPFGSFGFKVTVSDGGSMACFQEVSGLSAQVNVTDLVEGGCNHTTHKLIGNASFSNITLKRGLCDGSMFSWIQGVINGSNLQRRTITIEILGEERDEKGEYKPVKKFVCQRAIPVKWDGPSLNVSQDAIATESLELAHEGLTVG